MRGLGLDVMGVEDIEGNKSRLDDVKRVEWQ